MAAPAPSSAAPTPAPPAEPCPACEGRGYIHGADLGIVGMVDAGGRPVPIPCIACDGVAAANPCEARRDRP